MTIKRDIHTKIEHELYRKIKEYGHGCLNKGLKNLMDIAESKEVKVVINTEISL